MLRDLKADLELCQKATPGPWTPTPGNEFVAQDKYDEDDCRQGICRLLHKPKRKEDSEFIAAARTGWPDAIERAIVAESLIEDAGKELKEWMRRVNETEDKLKEVEQHNEHLIWSYEEYEAGTKAEIARLQAEIAKLKTAIFSENAKVVINMPSVLDDEIIKAFKEELAKPKNKQIQVLPQQHGYGLYNPPDPRDFCPDFEVCTRWEIEKWEQDRKKAENGEPFERGGWGMGSYKLK